MNISLGYIFGALYDGIGVIIAWVISLAVGSSIIYLSYHIRHRISLNELIPRTSILLITACLIAVLSTLIVHQKLEQFINSVVLNCLTLLLFLTIVSVPFWAHPMRKRLTAWIVDAFIKSKTSG
jgi:O-antigen/teichoic acid export membrane protein